MSCPYSQQDVLIPEDAHKLSAPCTEHFDEALRATLTKAALSCVVAQEVSRTDCKGEFVQCVDVNWQDSLIQDIYNQANALGLHMRIASAGHGSSAVSIQKTLTLYVIKAVDGRFRFADAYTIG